MKGRFFNNIILTADDDIVVKRSQDSPKTSVFY